MDESVVKHLEQPAQLDEASRLLLKAAVMIERHGWCQNELRSRSGALCVEAALNIAAGREAHKLLCVNSITSQALDRLRASVNTMAVYDWNDKPGRTKEEVIAKLRAAALGG